MYTFELIACYLVVCVFTFNIHNSYDVRIPSSFFFWFSSSCGIPSDFCPINKLAQNERLDLRKDSPHVGKGKDK